MKGQWLLWDAPLIMEGWGTRGEHGNTLSFFKPLLAIGTLSPLPTFHSSKQVIRTDSETVG